MTSALQGQTPISFIIPFMQMTLKVILDHFLFVFDYFGVVQPCSLALHAATLAQMLFNALLKLQVHSPVWLNCWM